MAYTVDNIAVDNQEYAQGADDPDTHDDADDENDQEILELARRVYKIDKEHWQPIFDKARDDLIFLSDEDEAQWPAQEFQDRIKTGRPAITIDVLTQFVHQVTNNIRMNTPSINPIPSDDALVKTAEVIKGLIRKIEYVSGADEVYDTAANFSVKCSIGFIRVDHDYEDEEVDGAPQQLLIKRNVNPFVIFMDSETMETDGRDQCHCNVLERMKVSEFKDRFEGFEPSSFDENSNDRRSYSEDEEVTISEFFIKMIDDDGNIRIMRYKLSGKDVLEKTSFPGEYIPVIPVYGEEAWKDGKRQLLSLIRKSKMAAYMYNLMQSVEAEILLKQPIAPVMVPAGAIENYKEDWIDPSKSMALRYDQFDKDGQAYNRPERLQPSIVPAGIVNMGIESLNNVKASMGLYNNAVGEQGQEVSGKAIDARKIQGDVSVYHFGDNLVRSITQVGRVLVSAMPEIYDTQRTISILNGEDKPQNVGINGDVVDGQEQSHDLTKGKYDIRVITGQSFSTMRQESAQFYQDLIGKQPQMINVCGDLMFENMDIQGAQAMAARMKKIINPALLEDDGQDPKVAALMHQIQQMQGVIQQGAAALQAAEAKLKDKNDAINAKTGVEHERNQIKMMEMQLKEQGQKIESLLKLGELHIKADANDITEQKNAGDLALKAVNMKVDTIFEIMTRLERAIQPVSTVAGQPGTPDANNGSGNESGVTNNG